jgi:molybdopterin-containing oxidoreductase family iron-sulfur binding subunit
MEKCTFCVQRIRSAKDVAKDEGRPVRDGEITPACVQTCPTNALVFGDLQDPESKVSKMAQDPRRYRILEDLNTEPAITYLKKIRQDSEG